MKYVFFIIFIFSLLYLLTRNYNGNDYEEEENDVKEENFGMTSQEREKFIYKIKLEYSKQIIDNINYKIVKVEKMEALASITIKLLIENKNNFVLSRLNFNIKLYDEQHNLIDVFKESIYDVQPHSETVGILNCLCFTKNISFYDVKLYTYER